LYTVTLPLAAPLFATVTVKTLEFVTVTWYGLSVKSQSKYTHWPVDKPWPVAVTVAVVVARVYVPAIEVFSTKAE
jgi:hypothetical protein